MEWEQRDAVYAKIRSHYHESWPTHRPEEFQWTVGPISHSLPRLTVSRFAPATQSDPWIYATSGAWEVVTAEEQRLEFFLQSPLQDPRLVGLLAMVANFHADPRYSLSLGSVVNIGAPWLDGSQADHLLVSLPYPYGPRVEYCHVDEKRHVRVLWLLPITGPEAALARSEGVEALETLLERGSIDTLEVERRSVV